MNQVEEFISGIRFNAQGLVPVVAQDATSKEVLMVAWMNAEAIHLTIDSGWGTYFSRSRNKIWVKGEESGNRQSVRTLQADCDQDTLLLSVDQSGSACHTGHDTPLDIQLWDRIPVSQNKEIEIGLKKQSQALSSDAHYLQTDFPLGLLRWDISIPANSTGESSFVLTWQVDVGRGKDVKMTPLPE